MGQLRIGLDGQGRPFTIDPSSLTKHCVVFGATGSGKTVLCKSIIEEATLSGIPVLSIDPKGDIACLAIRSLDFDFRPYSDVEAKLLGKSPEQYAKELTAEYQEKHTSVGHQDESLKQFVEGTDVRIYTPHSNDGLQVSMSPRLSPPKDFGRKLVEEPSLAFDLVELKASNLLRLAGYGEDGIVQRSLISKILEDNWKSGHELTLEKVIELVNSPPFEKLGMLPLDEAIGRRERSELSKRLNTLVADAGARARFFGQPPDFDRWFHKTKGRTPICTVDLRSIPGEEEKQVFVEFLLGELFYWLTRQEGTQTLRYILYFDEVQGYCPPVREPASKKILIHLIHVSRAFGLGIIMATQNPVDVDYKVMSNANFRFIGNLSTRQDIDRVRMGLSLGPDTFQVISSLKTRQFYYQIFDRGEAGILEPRWLMSYHRGPLEQAEIRRLSAGATPESVQVKALPLLVSQEVLTRELEKKRAKRGLLGGTEEKVEYAKVLYLPYLDFTYRYSAQKGFLFSKRAVLNKGRSALLALREAQFGFEPGVLRLLPELQEIELDSNSTIPGVESTSLVSERLEELRRLLSDYDSQIEKLRSKLGPEENRGSESIQEHIEQLEDVRSSRWNIFVDGLKLPMKTDANSLEILEVSLFYIPYFVAKLSRGVESRYLVWERRGKEYETLSEELMKNRRLRELIEPRASS